jgi:hypothetical protein
VVQLLAGREIQRGPEQSLLDLIRLAERTT